MNPIGGFFELELNRGKEYHESAIKLRRLKRKYFFRLL